jgi:hypothetical protein
MTNVRRDAVTFAYPRKPTKLFVAALGTSHRPEDEIGTDVQRNAAKSARKTDFIDQVLYSDSYSRKRSAQSVGNDVIGVSFIGLIRMSRPSPKTAFEHHDIASSSPADGSVQSEVSASRLSRLGNS